MRGWIFVLAIGIAHAQSSLSPDVALLVRIKEKTAANLTRLPNYTCNLVIERSNRRRPRDHFKFQDRVRLDVGYFGGTELFGLPGGKIQEPDITRLVPNGSIGTGDFALFPKIVFMDNVALFTFTGTANVNGQAAIRFEYRVPSLQPRYRLTTPKGRAITGFHGSFWVHAETLDLIRMTLEADDIPFSLGVAAVAHELNYARIPIGGADFLLPKSSEFTLTDVDGSESRNQISFEACRQFSGESKLSFDEPSAAPPAAKTEMAPLDLPEEFDLELRLETPIDSGAAAIGDVVRATVRRAANSIPKGATVTARIQMLRTSDNLSTLQLEVTDLDFEGHHADLGSRDNMVGLSAQKLSHTMVLRFSRIRLQRGTPLILRSLLVKSDHHDPIRP